MGFSNKGRMKMLLRIKSKGGKSIGVSLKLKMGVSSKVFTVSTLLAMGVRALARGTLGTYLGSLFAGVSSFLVLIEEKVVHRVSITSSIFPILEDFSSRDLIVSKVLTIFSMELYSLFKFP